MFPSWKSSKPSDAPVSSAFIHPSDYGFGQIVLPPETRRDPTPDEIDAARAADRISAAEIARVYGWSEADFEQARTFGLPSYIGSRYGWRGERTDYWSRAQLNVWRDRVLAFAATLAR